MAVEAWLCHQDTDLSLPLGGALSHLDRGHAPNRKALSNRSSLVVSTALSHDGSAAAKTKLGLVQDSLFMPLLPNIAAFQSVCRFLPLNKATSLRRNPGKGEKDAFGTSRTQGKRRIRPIPKETLAELYCAEGLSMAKIVVRLGAPHSNVEYWMKKHAIARRPIRKYPRLPITGDKFLKARVRSVWPPKTGDKESTWKCEW